MWPDHRGNLWDMCRCRYSQLPVKPRTFPDRPPGTAYAVDTAILYLRKPSTPEDRWKLVPSSPKSNIKLVKMSRNNNSKRIRKVPVSQIIEMSLSDSFILVVDSLPSCPKLYDKVSILYDKSFAWGNHFPALFRTSFSYFLVLKCHVPLHAKQLRENMAIRIMCTCEGHRSTFDLWQNFCQKIFLTKNHRIFWRQFLIGAEF